MKYAAAGPIANQNPNAIVLNKIEIDAATNSIFVNVTVAKAVPPSRGEDSFLDLWLPRYLIDASNATGSDASFTAFDNGEPLEYYIGPTYYVAGHIEERTDVLDFGGDPREVRVVAFGLEPGNHYIQIIGTSIAPEFAFLNAIPAITAACLALVLTVSRLTRISRIAA